MTKAVKYRDSGNSSIKKELLRKTILEAAALLFSERGFGGTNLQDLADSLNISRPTLYYYFKSKEDILGTLVEEVTVYSGQQSTQIATKGDANPGETLRQMVFNHARWILEHPIEFRVVARTESELPVAIRKIHERSKRLVLQNFTRIIERGIEIGQFRPVDSQIASFTIIGTCSWTAWWFRPEGRVPIEAIATQIADMAVQSIKYSNTERATKLELSDIICMLKDNIGYLDRLNDKK